MKKVSTILVSVFGIFGAGVFTGKLLFEPSGDEFEFREGSEVKVPGGTLTRVEAREVKAIRTHENDDPPHPSDPSKIRELADVLKQKPPSTHRRLELLAALDQWAAIDSEEVFRWLTAHESELPEITTAYSQTMKHHIRQNPDSAQELIEAMNEGSLKRALTVQLAQFFAEKDPQNSFEWSQQLPDLQARRTATSVALQALAKIDPDQALQLALAEKDAGLREEYFDHVGLVISRADPELTVQSLTDFPEEMQKRMIEHVAGPYAALDPIAASQWLAALSPGSTRDLAVSRSLRDLISHDPIQAFQLAESVMDTRERYGLMRDVLMQRYQLDPEAALSLLDASSQLTASQKNHLAQDLAKNAPSQDLVVPR